MEKTLKVNCPTCKKVYAYYDSEFRPFCCERCKMVDLGHWFEENYSVAGEKVQNREADFEIEENLDLYQEHSDDQAE